MSSDIRDKVDGYFNSIGDMSLISEIGLLSSANYGIYVKLTNGIEYHLSCKQVIPSKLEYEMDEFNLLSNSEKYKCFSSIKKYV